MKALFFMLLLLPFGVFAQQGEVLGKTTDEKGQSLEWSSVALLYPADSTVAYFGMTDTSGFFRIRNVQPGDYLLHISQHGYASVMKPVSVMQTGSNTGIIPLKLLGKNLEEVDIVAEYSPMQIKGDTIEYNSAAFRTKPDAAVEDLLKKLPGVEVDAAGNIKAQGNSVNKIMVDGKEFFSNDPKVVSKNLPAEAVKKVQVFDEKSDEEQFTAISDGQQNKTINLVLKEDRKKLWFGNAMAGAGNNYRFQSSVKAFNFQPERQLAFLGMANNINHFGFTLEDYMDYSGGIQSFMDGGGRVEINDDMPIDFGQPIFGNITSGIGAVNYTVSKKKGKSFNLTYMGSGQDKKLNQTSYTENYLQNGTIFSNGTTDERTMNGLHRFGFSYRDKSDSLKQLNLKGGLNAGVGRRQNTVFSLDTLNDQPITEYRNALANNYFETKADALLSYNRKVKAALLDVFKLNASADGTLRNSMTDWINRSRLYTINSEEQEEQIQKIDERRLNAEIGVSSIKKIGRSWYAEPSVQLAWTISSNDRRQERWQSGYVPVDSVSGLFTVGYQSLTPGIHFKRTGKKLTAQFNLDYETGLLTTAQKSSGVRSQRKVAYPVPSLSLQYDIAQTHHLGLDMASVITPPALAQLNPIPSTVNRLQIVNGNLLLKPEYSYRANMNWNIYDNFTFLSAFASLQGVYTTNKINLARTINPDFSQSVTYVNVDQDINLAGRIEFSSPVRKLKINVHIQGREQWNRGISLVNGIANTNINRVHSGEFSIDNRKKTKWDAKLGVRISYTTSAFSLQPQLNGKYTEVAYFSTVDYSPNDKWSFDCSADLATYSSSAGSMTTFVPLLKCSVTRFLLKNNRASVSFEIFDILNRNTGIQQQPALNYFRQTQSNILSRYGMLTLTYKLNKGGR